MKRIILAALLVTATAGVGIVLAQDTPQPVSTQASFVIADKPEDMPQTTTDATQAPVVEQTQPVPTTEPAPAPTPVDTRPTIERATEELNRRGVDNQNIQCFVELITKTIGWDISYEKAVERIDYIQSKYASMCNAQQIALSVYSYGKRGEY